MVQTRRRNLWVNLKRATDRLVGRTQDVTESTRRTIEQTVDRTPGSRTVRPKKRTDRVQ